MYHIENSEGQSLNKEGKKIENFSHRPVVIKNAK